MKLENAKCLITGGSKGIGRATVELLLEQGAIVYSISRTSSGVKHKNYHEKLLDLSLLTKNPEMLEEWRTIDYDVLINNIGYNPGMEKFIDLTKDTLDISFELNINVHVFLTRFLKYRKVVFVDSVLGLVTVPKAAIYCASKHFLKSFSDGLRREGIDSASVFPGSVDTDMFPEYKNVMSVKKESVAKCIVNVIKCDKRASYIPFLNRFVPLVDAILPIPIMDWMIRTLLKIVAKHYKQ